MTWLAVIPYLRQCGPPALVDTLPPMDDTIWLEGSGAKNHPRASTARVSQRLISPGWTVAQRFGRSISRIRFIRFRPTITPPSGAMAPLGGVMVGLNRMNRILEIDLPNRCATVQPGLINLWLTRAVEARGWFFAPDPSSQMVSSIGGNVSTNAGGPHCLKYGITANHVMGLELVTG